MQLLADSDIRPRTRIRIPKGTRYYTTNPKKIGKPQTAMRTYVVEVPVSPNFDTRSRENGVLMRLSG